MTNNETPEGSGWLTTIIGGGIPQILLGPAGKAISRLVGATVEIPAAKLDGIAQGIRDKTEARSQISKAIAKRVAELSIDNPDVMERAMNNMLDREYRVQKNKDAVAVIALQDLHENPPNAESEGPSDDFLTKFERYAEDASSDDLRMMFGKILAGEIRNPGTISPATLHFVSMLDGQTAKLIERALPFRIQGQAIILQCVEPELSIPEIIYLEQSGFWTPDNGLTWTLDDNGVAIKPIQTDKFPIAKGSPGIALHGNPGQKVHLEVGVLSKAGLDLANTIQTPLDVQTFSNILLSKHKIDIVKFGICHHDGVVTSMPNPISTLRK